MDYSTKDEAHGRHNFKIVALKKIVKELKRMNLIIPFGK